MDSVSHAYQSGQHTKKYNNYPTTKRPAPNVDFRPSKFEKKSWTTEERPKFVQARYNNDRPKGYKYNVKSKSIWGFKRTFDQKPQTFFDEIDAEVAAELSPKPVSTFELYEDEEFVVTKYSASGSKDASFSHSDQSVKSVLNPEEL